MHSSHHAKGCGKKVEGGCLTIKEKLPWLVTQKKTKKGMQLPPTCLAQTLSIHLPHVTHSNDANGGIIHVEIHVGIGLLSR
jgi:hypothetical protein